MTKKAELTELLERIWADLYEGRHRATSGCGPRVWMADIERALAGCGIHVTDMERRLRDGMI